MRSALIGAAAGLFVGVFVGLGVGAWKGFEAGRTYEAAIGLRGKPCDCRKCPCMGRGATGDVAEEAVP